MKMTKIFATIGLMLGLGAPLAQAADISGAGATFPFPLYSKWSQVYAAEKGVQINYQSIGSGGGIRQVTNQTVFFGATDGPMTNEQLQAAPGKILHFPTVLGAVVPVFNVPGATQLRGYRGNITPDGQPGAVLDVPGAYGTGAAAGVAGGGAARSEAVTFCGVTALGPGSSARTKAASGNSGNSWRSKTTGWPSATRPCRGRRSTAPGRSCRRSPRSSLSLGVFVCKTTRPDLPRSVC